MAVEHEVVYHERQKLQFCLLHTLNNLFQENGAFTRSSLNDISIKLDHESPSEATWNPVSLIFKPHHNELTGNYDVNVLIAALQGRGKSVTWHDKRVGCSSINLEDENESKLFGIVLNVLVRRYRGLWKGRHWIALRKIGSFWYNLDSDLSDPRPFENTEELREFLDGILYSGGEIFLIMNQTMS